MCGKRRNKIGIPFSHPRSVTAAPSVHQRSSLFFFKRPPHPIARKRLQERNLIWPPFFPPRPSTRRYFISPPASDKTNNIPARGFASSSVREVTHANKCGCVADEIRGKDMHAIPRYLPFIGARLSQTQSFRYDPIGAAVQIEY